MSYQLKRAIPGHRPTQIELEGRRFSFVIHRRGEQSAIYKGNGEFARIGKPNRILADIAFHKKMLALGFPVAPILAEGQSGEDLYFIEKSLGEKHFGDIFADEFQKTGKISTASFEDFLTITEQVARAQIGSAQTKKDWGAFFHSAHLDTIGGEFPDLSNQIQTRYKIAKEKIAALPFVMTHGDFNPHNIYPLGVIDFEHTCSGPYGYDLISALIHIDYFPDSREYEYTAGYRFSKEQQTTYLARIDSLSQNAGLPKPSAYIDDLHFFRAIWMLANIAHTPLLQKFRKETVIERFFKDSLSG